MMKKLLVLMAWVVCSVASLWHANAQEENFDAVVNLSEAGKLYDEAPDNIWEETAVSVKIIGKLNSYDLRVLRQFCGSDEYGTKRPHASVRRIDLSEATIVPGGGTYYIRVEDLGNMREYVVDETQPDMLPEKLFYGCSTIESLTLPKHIRSIGIGAFFKCENLKEVIIPDEVTHIYATVFGACPVLEEIKLPSKLEFLGNYAFTHCRALKEITIPEGVKEIRHNSFDQTDALKVINLPQEMETFDESAFFGATGLEELVVPKGIKTIPTSCFGYCTALQKITFPTTVESVANEAFEGDAALKTVVFAEGLKTIGVAAFRNCSSIEKLNFPNSLESIATDAFLSCEKVKEITFGSGLKEIKEKSFWHNHAVEKISFPESLTEIGYAAFSECLGLKEVNFGRSAASFSGNPFLGCFGLERFTADEGNTAYAAKEGVLYTKNLTKLLAYPNMSNKVCKMPDATTTIDDFAFWYCTNLEEVEFSPNFAAFGERAFCGSKNIKKITVKTATPVESAFVDDVFEGINRSECILMVPQGSKSAYLASPLWKDFKITEMTALAPVAWGADVALRTTSEGWEVVNLPQESKEVRLLDLEGRLLAVATPQAGRVLFSISAGEENPCIIVVMGGATPLVFKAVR